MTLVTCYYPEFRLSSSLEIPDSLRNLLYDVWQHHYEELYEDEADGTTSLEYTIEEILKVLWNEDDLLGHSRYVLMALILQLAVKPTMDAYLPNDKRPEVILRLTAMGLEQAIELSKREQCATGMLTSNTQVASKKEVDLLNSSSFSGAELNNQLFSQKSVGNQAINEALDVFRNGLKVLDASQAREALLEILDDCFEGYAVFPGSQGRRDLFNWWIIEVVPATWCLRIPKVIYTIKGVQNLLKDIFNKPGLEFVKNRPASEANLDYSIKNYQKKLDLNINQKKRDNKFREDIRIA